MPNELLNAEQMAERLGVSAATVLLWAGLKGMPCIRPTRRCVRFDPVEVDQWLRENFAHGEGCHNAKA